MGMSTLMELGGRVNLDDHVWLSLSTPYFSSDKPQWVKLELTDSTPPDLTDWVAWCFKSAFKVTLPHWLTSIQLDVAAITGIIQPNGAFDFSCQLNEISNPVDLAAEFSFYDLNFSLDYATTGSKKKAVSDLVIAFDGSVKLGKGFAVKGLPDNLTAGVWIGQGTSIFSLELHVHDTLSFSTVLESLLDIEVSGNAALTGLFSLIPTFSQYHPTSGNPTPIIVYYSSFKKAYTPAGQLLPFQPGFNVGAVVVSIVNHSFLASMRYSKSGFNLMAACGEIDLGILKLEKPTTGYAGMLTLGDSAFNGPQCCITTSGPNKGIGLKTNVNFLNASWIPEVSLDYDAADDVFKFDLSGIEIFGNTVSIGGSWSKTNGFQLDNLPLGPNIEAILKDISTLIHNESKNNPRCGGVRRECGPIANLSFRNKFHTKFKVSVRPTTGATLGYFGVNISGSFSVELAAGLSVSDIPFALVSSLQVKIPKPSGSSAGAVFEAIGIALADTMTDASNSADIAQSIVHTLYNHRKKFIKVMALLGVKLATKAALKELACYQEEEEEQLKKDLINNAEESGDDPGNDESWNDLLDEMDEGDAEEALSVVGEFALDDLVIDFIPAGLAVIAGLVILIEAYDYLFDHSEYGAKKRRLANANKLQAHARQVAAAKLTSATTPVLTYTPPQQGIPATLYFQYFKVRTDKSVNYVVTCNNSKIHSGSTPTTVAVPFSAYKGGQSLKVSVRANYSTGGHNQQGNIQPQTLILPVFEVSGVTPVYHPSANTITVTWKVALVGPDTPSTYLKATSAVVQLMAEETAQTKEVQPAVDGKAPTTATMNLTKPTPFTPQLGTNYSVSVQIVADFPAFSSVVVSGGSFTLQGGVGHAVIGENFTVGEIPTSQYLPAHQQKETS